MNRASLSFGNSEIMLSSGGKPSTAHRREVDLYVTTNNVDDLYKRLPEKVQIVEEPHDTF